MIPFQEILKFAYKIPPEIIEKDYCLNWLLYGLSDSSLSNDLVFYGGTALKKIYFIDYRFSEDLDFISVKDLGRKEIEQGFNKIYKTLSERVNINFRTKTETISFQDNRIQFFVSFDGFSEITLDKQIKVDILIKQKLLGPPLRKNILSPYSDSLTNKELKVFSLESIAADKILAIADLSRQEPRDIYDLNYLLACRQIDYSKVLNNLESKLGYVFPLKSLLAQIASGLYKSRWESRLKNQIIDLPEFSVISKELRSNVERLYEK